jgi:lambda repressor-like predicted transcriptional regulator
MATKRSKEEWAVLVGEYKRSGQPLAPWCKAHGVSAKTMSNHTKSNHTNKRKLSKRTPEEWSLLLADLADSGLSLSEWCRKNGLNENAVYSAQHRMAMKTASSKDLSAKQDRASFVRVHRAIPDDTPESGFIKATVSDIRLEADAKYPIKQFYELITRLREQC